MSVMGLISEDANGNVEASRDLVDAYLFRLPRAFRFADYIWPGLLMSAENL